MARPAAGRPLEHRYLPTPQGFRARRIIRELRAQVARVVAERRAVPRGHDGSLDVAAACGTMDPAELAEHLLVLLFASVNIPVAVTNCLHCVATHPTFAQRLEDEVASGAPEQKELRAALDESLRLFPVWSMIPRNTLERFLATWRMVLVSAVTTIASSLPLALRSTRVRLTARR